MANRHQRRKAAKVKATAKTEALAQAERSLKVSRIVRGNLKRPIGKARFVFVCERIRKGAYYSEVKLVYDKNAYDASCPIADMKANIYLGFREPRAGGAMNEKSVQALASRKNVSFGKADGLTADSASEAGQYLSGRKIREARYAEQAAKLDRVRGNR